MTKNLTNSMLQEQFVMANTLTSYKSYD